MVIRTLQCTNHHAMMDLDGWTVAFGTAKNGLPVVTYRPSRYSVQSSFDVALFITGPT